MTDTPQNVSALPRPSAILELFKPITWFASMWAYACGVVSAGRPIFEAPGLIILGIVLCGPLVCATSQAVNDWFDRHVDAINEPMRPIPSGRIPGNWGLYIAIGWTIVSLGVGWLLGDWGFYATCVGLALAWAYSAPPFRLKRNGWYGNSAVAVCYEGLPWITGAAVMGAAMPDAKILAFAALYSVGAHGIMTLNDFKSIDGDLKMGIGSLPARLGVARAAKVACAFMALPQAAAILLLLYWGHPFAAIAVIAALGIQLLLMMRLLAAPAARAPWYNATGTGLYVLGMMACAIAIGANA